jgi:hypothetical protein
MRKLIELTLNEFIDLANSSGIPSKVGDLVVDKQSGKWYAHECIGFITRYGLDSDPQLGPAMAIVIVPETKN